MKHFFLLLLLFAFTGCETLPDGDPPKGNIVSPFVVSKTLSSREQAVNCMITDLTMEVSMLASSGRPVMSCETKVDKRGVELGQQIIKELKRDGVIGINGTSRYVLKSETKILGVLPKDRGSAIEWSLLLLTKEQQVIYTKKIVFRE
jgi:hypothetical protein